jgi:heme-degrading monooxygenase HmoA
MIARLWRGVTPASKADAYADYLEQTGLKDYRATEGNQGLLLLRQTHDDTAEFLLFSFWESIEAIQRFAGEDIDKAVYYPEDEHYLISMDPQVTHYEVLADLRDSQ